MNQPTPLQVKDIGEQGLLKRIQQYCPPHIVGDDAAVLDIATGQSIVVTTDMLIDGVHFSDLTTSPEDAGWRAAAANLSDLAAMGAQPLAITIGLGVTGTTSVQWVERLYQGILSCLQQHNTVIAGGDVVRSPVNTLSITAFGQAYPHRTIRRSAAQPGYVILVTGPHGGSRAGLELLLHPELGENLTPQERHILKLTHQRPKPRLDEIPLLWEILAQQYPMPNAQCPMPNAQYPMPNAQCPMPNAQYPMPNAQYPIPNAPCPMPHAQYPIPNAPCPMPNAQCPIPIAGMDSSDGLADAMVQICQASSVGAIIDRDKIPTLDSLHRLVSPQQALHWSLYGGEDFELVLCLPEEFAQKLVSRLGAGAAIIGTINQGAGVWLTGKNENDPDEELTLSRGFQHF